MAAQAASRIHAQAASRIHASWQNVESEPSASEAQKMSSSHHEHSAFAMVHSPRNITVPFGVRNIDNRTVQNMNVLSSPCRNGRIRIAGLLHACPQKFGCTNKSFRKLAMSVERGGSTAMACKDATNPQYWLSVLSKYQLAST